MMYRFYCWVGLIGMALGVDAQDLSKVSVHKSEQITPSIYKSPSYDNVREKMKRDFPSEFRFFDDYAFDNAQLNESITRYLEYTRRERVKNIGAASVGLALGIPSMFLLTVGTVGTIGLAVAYLVDRRSGNAEALGWSSAYLLGGLVLGGATAAIVVPLDLSARKDRKKALHFSMEMVRMMPQ